MKKLARLILAGAAIAAAFSPAEVQAQFGSALAVQDGTVMVADAGRVLGPGAIVVYQKDAAGNWVDVAELKASDGEAGDLFGTAFSVDGNTLLAAGRGGVYVFENQSGSWVETGKLEAADVAEGDGFGQALHLVGDHAFVGAMGQNDANGAVYVFHRENGGWNQMGGKLTVAETGTGFGASVSFDGTNLAVGAPMANNRVGAAYVFTLGEAGFAQSAVLEENGLSGRTQYGQVVHAEGGWILVSAPFANSATGGIYGYYQMDGEWEEVGMISAFDGGSRSVFGASLAVTPDQIFAGAIGVDSFAGAVYAFLLDDTGANFLGVQKIRPGEGFEGRTQAGAALATDGDVVAVTVAGADNGAGSVMILEAEVPGHWERTAVIQGPIEGFDPVRGGEVGCTEGDARGWECSEVDLVSFVPVAELAGDENARGVRTNDNWGWQDPETGKYYALVGMTDRASFVDFTDPLNPVVLGILPMTETANSSAWRDIKTYRNHAFIVSDGAGQHGMQVFDLTRLRDLDGSEPVVFEADALYTEIASSHNIVINEDTGFAYSVGSSSGGVTCGGGLHIIDIRDPKNPTFAGCFSDPQTGRASTGYTHDAQCVTYTGPDEDYSGREICFGANETALSIADVTDKENTVALSRAAYPSVGYSHQGWLTDDQRYFYMNDELDELQGLVGRTRTMIWDVSDLDDPQLIAEHLGEEESSDHNLYIVGNLMYQSNYQSGLRILDIQDPANPTEVAYFDTVPYGDNGAGFGGSWSNYPFFDNGLVLVTSGNEGLFVVRPTIRRTVF